MQRMSKKNLKLGLPMLAAAAASAYIGLPAAHANFTLGLGDGLGNYITTFASQATINGVLYDDYIVQTTNDGTNSTGTDILGFDATLDTNPQPENFTSTAGALYIDLADQAKNTKSPLPDANVLGNTATVTPNVVFGNPAAGTFIGLPDPINTDPNTGNYIHTDFSGEGGKIVAINASTATQSGQGHAVPPAAVIVATDPKTTAPTAAAIPIDSQFTNHVIHSLEVAVSYNILDPNNGGGGDDTSSFPAPIANVVIPDGTGFTLSGVLENDIAPGQPGSANQNFSFSVGTVTPPPNFSHVTLTASGSPANTPTGGPITMSGGNGSYVEQDVLLTSAAKGSLVVNGFTKSGGVSDTELYALDVLVNGTAATPGQLNAIIGELTTAGLASGESIGTTSTSSTFGSQYNLFFTFVNPAADPAFNYDFSQSSVTGVTIPEIGVVPEPTGVGVLALGAVGLMARRRRLSKANA